MFDLNKLTAVKPMSVEYSFANLTRPDQQDNWHRAKSLHIHLISGIVCRKMALDIFPEFEKVSALIYNKDWDKMIKGGRSPYFIDNRISLGKRRGTCDCHCSVEYVADEFLYGGGYPKVKPNPYLGLRQEEDAGYFNDGEKPVQHQLPPFRFSTQEINIKEA